MAASRRGGADIAGVALITAKLPTWEVREACGTEEGAVRETPSKLRDETEHRGAATTLLA